MPILTIPDVPPRLLKDLAAWAKLRHKTQDAAAIELLKLALEVTSPKQVALMEQHQKLLEDMRAMLLRIKQQNRAH